MATKRMKMNFDTTAVLKGLRDIDVTLNNILTTRNKNITAEKKEREEFEKIKKAYGEGNEVAMRYFGTQRDGISKRTLEEVTKNIITLRKNIRELQSGKQIEGITDLNRQSIIDEYQGKLSKQEEIKKELDIDTKKETFKGDLGKTIVEETTSFFKDIKKQISSFFSETIKEAKKLSSEMATYNLQNSLFINREAREQALRYGLSASKNWAFTQAKSMIGIQNEEDLYYMNATQRQKFSEFMDKYSKIYNDLESTGYFSKMQDYQLKMKEFTLDSQLKVSKFFAENGDVLISVAEAGLNVLTGILSFATGIYDFLQGGDMKAKATTGVDLLASTYNTNSDNSKVVNVSTTINANSTEEANKMIKQASDVLWTPYIKALDND